MVATMTWWFPSAVNAPAIGSNCFQAMPRRLATIAAVPIVVIASGRTTSDGTKSQDLDTRVAFGHLKDS